MKKVLGIVVLGLLLSSNAYPFIATNYETGYVYIALKTNENLDYVMSNNEYYVESLNKLGCAEGFEKTKIDKLPPGYAEDVPQLLKKKYQPLRMYKIICQTKEKPKKSPDDNKIDIASLDQKSAYAHYLNYKINFVNMAWWNNNNLSANITPLDHEIWKDSSVGSTNIADYHAWVKADFTHKAEAICLSLSERDFKPISDYSVTLFAGGGRKIVSLNCK